MRKLTTEEYKSAIIDTGIELIDERGYVSSSTKVLHRHIQCGHEWLVRPDSIKQGYGCPRCAKEKATHTTEEYKSDIIDTGIELIDESGYVSSNTKVLHRHIQCGHEWLVRPSSIKQGRGCPRCAGQHSPTTEQYKSDIIDTGIELIDERGYVTNKTKLLHRHIQCGHEWLVRPSSIKQGSGCPKCDESKGENKTRRFLKQNNIHFESEYTFDGCRHKNVLPFDFWIPQYRICIEYQGMQHFQTTNNGFFGGESALKGRKKRDQIKRDFCKRSKIILVEIPYNDERIGQRIMSAIAQRKKERNEAKPFFFSNKWGRIEPPGTQLNIFNPPTCE